MARFLIKKAISYLERQSDQLTNSDLDRLDDLVYEDVEAAESTRESVKRTMSKEDSEWMKQHKVESALNRMEKIRKRDNLWYEPIEGIDWDKVKAALLANPKAVDSLDKMSVTYGKPDIIAVEDNCYVFADCSAEAPVGRRNLTYAEAIQMADEFGVEMMGDEYYVLQNMGKFDRDSYIYIMTKDNPLDSTLTNCIPYTCLNEIERDEDGEILLHLLSGPKGGRSLNQGWRGVLRVPKVA